MSDDCHVDRRADSVDGEMSGNKDMCEKQSWSIYDDGGTSGDGQGCGEIQVVGKVRGASHAV